jgi:hypothetical protein
MPRKPELKAAWAMVSATPETEFGIQANPLLFAIYRQNPAKPFNCFNLQQKRAGQIPLVTSPGFLLTAHWIIPTNELTAC